MLKEETNIGGTDKGHWKTDGKGTIIECDAKESLLSEIVIPYKVGNEKITAIGNEVFNNWSVKKVIIPNNIQIIGSGAFANCTNLTEITMSSVTSIEYSAFYNCQNLTKVVLPDTLNKICLDAFVGTGVNELYIPANVTYIDPEFPNMSHETLKDYQLDLNINVSNNNKVYSSEDGILFNKNKTVLIHYPMSRTGTYTIPDGVTTIKEFAFLWSHLTEISIPKSMRTIEIGAFCATGLTKINIEEGLENIGERAFLFSGGLAHVDLYLPNSITTIGNNAFLFQYYDKTGNIYFAPGNNPIPAGAPWGADGATVTKLEK